MTMLLRYELSFIVARATITDRYSLIYDLG